MTLTAAAGTAGVRCPKHMTYGPCAGVDGNDACEVAGVGRCTFLTMRPLAWPVDAPPLPLQRTSGMPRVVAHLAASPLDADSLRRCAGALSPVVDAVLCGDSPSARVQLPPAYRARILLDEGIPVMSGLNCRDRNRVALEGEIAALADLSSRGLVGVHCVTGDHPVLGHRADAMPVIDPDATRLTSLAAQAGLLVSVAATPQSPPGIVPRAERLAVKAHAGDRMAMLDDVSVEIATQFSQACSAAGADVAMLAGVPGISGIHLSPGVVPGQELQSMTDVAELAGRLR